MRKNKVNTVMEVLHKVSVEFLNTTEFNLFKYLKENISLKVVIFFDRPISKELAQRTFFYCVVLDFISITCFTTGNSR